MSDPVLSWYDVLDVDPSASPEEVRLAWRDAVSELGPTDRRFRVLNQAAEVLLDPQRRAVHDAELAAAEHAEAAADETPVLAAEPVDSPPRDVGPVDAPAVPVEPAKAEPVAPPVSDVSEGPRRRTVPAWLLAGLAVLTAVLVGLCAWQWSSPADTEVRDATVAAQGAAERAIVPVLSYDYRTLEEDQATAQSYLTDSYRKDYDELFEFLRENAPTPRRWSRPRCSPPGSCAPAWTGSRCCCS